MASEMELSEEQARFLSECEEEFSDRYTDSDSEFVLLRNKPLSHPPLVEQWGNNQRNQWSDCYNQRGGNHYSNRSRDHQRHWRGNSNSDRDRSHDAYPRRTQDDRFKDRSRSDRSRYNPY